MSAILSFKKKYASTTVTAGYVAETGPTIDTNAVDTLKLNVKNPRKSSKPATIKNRKINLVGREIFVLVNPTQENKVEIATNLKNKSAMIGPDAATMGLINACDSPCKHAYYTVHNPVMPPMFHALSQFR